MKELSFREYQEKAILTLSDKGKSMNVVHCVLGLATEIGEILDPIKKGIFYKEDVTFLDYSSLSEKQLTNISEEIGDMSWYIWSLLAQFDASEYEEFMTEVYEDTKTFAKFQEEITIDSSHTEDLKATSAILVAFHLSHGVSTLEQLLHNGLVSYYQEDSNLDIKTLNLDDTEFDSKSFVQQAVSITLLLFHLCKVLDLDYSSIVETNLQKLMKRYDGAKFSSEKAINRDTEAELKVLQQSESCKDCEGTEDCKCSDQSAYVEGV